MKITEARCTSCGASLELNKHERIIKCQYCQTTVVTEYAVEFVNISEQEASQVRRLRENLKEATLKNNITEIDRTSSLIKDMIPSDFSANYYYGYAKEQLGDAYSLYSFYENTLEGSPDEIESVIDHLTKYSELRDKQKISLFIERYSKQRLHAYLEEFEVRKDRLDYYDSSIKRDVFICHRSTDLELVEKLVEEIEKDGYECWVSYRNLRPNDSRNYWSSIEEAIDNCSLFLCVASESAMLSKDVQYELKYSVKTDKKRIEYKVDEAKNTRLFKEAFDGSQWVDGTTPRSEEKLLDRVHKELNKKNKKDKTLKNRKKLLIALVFVLISVIGGYFIFNGQTTSNNVLDITAPVITLKGDQNMIIDVGQPFQDPGFLADDNYDLAEDITLVITGVVDSYTEGIYSVTYQATDSQGNVSIELTRTVEVIDFKVDFTWNLKADDTYEVTGYIGTDTDIAIPAVVDGIIVTSIGENAFDGLAIISLYIPNSIELIKEQAFASTSLRSVIFEEDSHLHTIESEAFRHAKFTSIILPKTLSTIGYSAFRSSEIQYIYVDDKNQYFSSLDGVLFNKNQSKIIYYPSGKTETEYRIPSTVNTISHLTFYEINIYSINIYIPSNVLFVESSAFYNFNYATIFIEDASRPATWNADWNPDSLNSNWGTDMTVNNLDYHVALKSDGTYEIVEYLGVGGDVIIPTTINGKTVTSIAGYAFGQKDITSVYIPETIQAMGTDPFSYNFQLVSIVVDSDNSNYVSVDGVLFNSNQTILITYPSAKTNNTYTVPSTVLILDSHLFNNADNLNEIIIPEGVTTLKQGVFTNLNIAEITLPSTVTVIEHQGGIPNSAVLNVYVDENNETYKSIDGVLFSKDGKTLIALPGGRNIAHYEVPFGTEVIAVDSVRNRNITEFIIPKSVLVIEERAFDSLVSVRSILIPDSVTTIGEAAFVDFENFEIYAESLSKPSGWNVDWNIEDYPVTWGYIDPNNVGDPIVDEQELVSFSQSIIEADFKSINLLLLPARVNNISENWEYDQVCTTEVCDSALYQGNILVHFDGDKLSDLYTRLAYLPFDTYEFNSLRVIQDGDRKVFLIYGTDDYADIAISEIKTSLTKDVSLLNDNLLNFLNDLNGDEVPILKVESVNAENFDYFSELFGGYNGGTCDGQNWLSSFLDEGQFKTAIVLETFPFTDTEGINFEQDLLNYYPSFAQVDSDGIYYYEDGTHRVLYIKSINFDVRQLLTYIRANRPDLIPLEFFILE